jgi:hypothetical protein
MAVTTYVYNSAKKDILSGAILPLTDTIKAAFVTSSYTVNIDTHTKFSDITNEITGTNYTAGGFTLANKTITQDNTNDLAYFDADDISQATSTFTFRGIVIYKSTGTSSTSNLLFFIDLGVDRTYAAETCVVQWPTTGIAKIA